MDAGRWDDARSGLEGCLTKARAVGSVDDVARIQNNLAKVDIAQGNLPAARQRWTEAFALYRQLKMPKESADVASSLTALTAREAAAAAWKAHAALLTSGGVLVTGIQPGSQAEQAGLQPGDILVRYDRTRLDKPDTLIPHSKATEATKPVTLEILRGAQKLTVKVHGGLLGITVADLPPNPAAPAAPASAVKP